VPRGLSGVNVLQSNLSHKPVVLVAEDEPLVLQNAFDIVEDAGFTALGAQDGDHALRIIESRGGDIRILFTDIIMPGTLNGPTLAALVRNRWPEIQLIITSGRVDLTEVDAPSGTRFIQKPYRFSEIAAHLQALSHQGL
jgi:DNA-binding NtrC family response regulator